MLPSLQDLAHARRGEILVLGSLVHRRPWFPGRGERAALVAHYLPLWAVASGITAGWVWTGMGSPEPWCVLREEKPGISPLERVAWRARIRSPRHHVTNLGELRITNPDSTVDEILLGTGQIDVCAAQIMMLATRLEVTLPSARPNRRSSVADQEHQKRVLARVDVLRSRHPDITR